ncbi:hypothetical protein BP00DRAFT_418427 [Aspergillus indologenus CBS 114.80]|uniref:Uncharacterized protein n=1 Tax=Aspergillus indologenus CBS 114.80 TaxID=1450541 RepID=A0A2V5I1E8_9EURO|nr:hypothetical protein BP00DRAFT_418427 [Aspergillus indologenus CBS 114.80]
MSPAAPPISPPTTSQTTTMETPPSPASSPTSSFPLLPAISLILSCLFCLYRLQGPIRTCYRRIHARHSGRTEYARLATVENGPSSPPPSPNRPLPEHPVPGRADALPTTPLSKYFDPHTALLYADVFEQRTSPPALRDLEVEVEGEVGLGQQQQQQQRGDSDSVGHAGVGVGVLGEWFERLVEGVARYYEGLVWGKQLDRDLVAGMDGAAQYGSSVDVKVQSRQGGPPEE